MKLLKEQADFDREIYYIDSIIKEILGSKIKINKSPIILRIRSVINSVSAIKNDNKDVNKRKIQKWISNTIRVMESIR